MGVGVKELQAANLFKFDSEINQHTRYDSRAFKVLLPSGSDLLAMSETVIKTVKDVPRTGWQRELPI